MFTFFLPSSISADGEHLQLAAAGPDPDGHLRLQAHPSALEVPRPAPPSQACPPLLPWTQFSPASSIPAFKLLNSSTGQDQVDFWV